MRALLRRNDRVCRDATAPAKPSVVGGGAKDSHGDHRTYSDARRDARFHPGRNGVQEPGWRFLRQVASRLSPALGKLRVATCLRSLARLMQTATSIPRSSMT